MIQLPKPSKGVPSLSLIGTSIYGGAAVGLGAVANVLIGGKLGALVFSIGLLTVLYFNLALYTGKVCYPEKHSVLNYTIIYACNAVGAAFVADIICWTRYSRQVIEVATVIMQRKIADNPISLLILGYFCNVCIYIAVETFRTHVGVERAVMTIIPVFAFVACGFEHSIANYTYLIMCDEMQFRILDVLKVIFFVTLGNTIGGLSMSLGIAGPRHDIVR